MRIDENGRKRLDLLCAVLGAIRDQYGKLYEAKHHEVGGNPFDNTGKAYKNDVFSVQAYQWREDDDFGDATPEDPPNFVYKSLKVWWYKQMGRGTFAEIPDEDYTIGFLEDMIADCTQSMLDDPRLTGN